MASWQVKRSVWLWGVAVAATAGAAEYMMTGGTSGWAPLVAGVLGALVPVVFGLLQGSSGATSEALASSGQADQVPTRSRYTIKELTAAMEGDLTSLERDRRKKPLVGEPVVTTGVVADVGQAAGTRQYWLNLRVGDSKVMAWFQHSWLRRPGTAIEALRVGDRVRLQGRVDDIDRSSVRLERAELLEVLAKTKELAETGLDQASSGPAEPEVPGRSDATGAEIVRSPVRYTAAEIISAMAGETEVGRKAKSLRYKGETLEESGDVVNVRESLGMLFLSIRVDDEHLVHADFAEPHPGVRTLARGEKVRVRGQFSAVDLMSLSLKDPELVEVRSAAGSEETQAS